MIYKEVLKDAYELSLKIPKDKYRAIHPIPAGGIAIGVVVAQSLNIGEILSIEEYKNYKNKGEVLVIDDLVDSGKTLLRYSESDAAVLYKKPHSPKPTYYLKDINSEWITFPHEKDKDGILHHITRVFSFVDIRLTEEQEKIIISLLNKFKQK